MTLTCIACLICGLALQALDPAAAARVEARLKEFAQERRIPGIAAAVGAHGEVAWSAAIGVKDLESGAPVTATTVFPLGSTSKPLTSLLLGQLVEQGKLDLDAPVQTYVPYFPPKDHPITVRQLAGHLSGIRDYNRAAGEYDNTRRFERVRDAVAVFASDPLLFQPGTRHAYSAYNFVLLSAALEGASGQDYLSLLRDRLTVPLGLQRTGPNLPPQPDLVSSYAVGMMGRIVSINPGDASNKWAAGGLVSTPLEMVRLGNAVLAGKVVSPATFELLTTPQKLADGSDSGAGYGLGWRRGSRTLPDGRVVPVVHHGGTAPGAMSFFAIYPTENLVVSLQGNLLFEPFTAFSQEAFRIAESVLAARRSNYAGTARVGEFLAQFERAYRAGDRAWIESAVDRPGAQHPLMPAYLGLLGPKEGGESITNLAVVAAPAGYRLPNSVTQEKLEPSIPVDFLIRFTRMVGQVETTVTVPAGYRDGTIWMAGFKNG
ncbi:MAG: serine hydrolase domain-containing protein [Phycisphaerales bacterium]